ncbi:DNA polymerase III subunit gamma/tau [Terrimonas sp. NA20]|uniref:DNA polymerase III subunit gamma/tau n=1 Tax=Terrimonas ginsenosidimutans TaxID=2908004 RepID=A0ABS9KVS5_9BACT|nr:DNA polymerase III subunit gamma/tau [Terrimonas ginsenosidimutans]MCG2616469.1 DNA polymerase III subunit gamma/tau [Terrimonas ginsenosidimutans]
MDKFIVSARKYRPQLFDTVVGQSHITTTLKNAIRNNQLAHAFLFCGPRGVGKTTCARILAKTINCEAKTPEGEACNTCHSCVSFNDGISLNIHELDAASNNSVDDIRTLVEQVRFAPQAGKYKVYIIDEVHMLSSSAFNAFLKTLEEPPSYAIFILATTEKHKILPTILSRCQIFDFKRITTNDTVEHLQEICTKEEVSADKAALQIIAQKSEGCMRDALSIMDKIVSFTGGQLNYTNTLEHLNILDADYYFKLLDAMLQQDLAGALVLYDGINRKGFEGDLVLNGFAEFSRNLLVCKDEKAADLLEVVESFRDKYVDTAKKVSAPILISTLNILNEAEINFKAARNKRLHVELVLIKLCYLQQAINLSADSTGLSKKKLIESAKPVAFRQIVPLELKERAVTEQSPAKLIIETPSVNPAKTTTRQEAPPPKAITPATQPAAKPVSATPAAGAGKIAGLSAIRDKFKGNALPGTNVNQPLNEELLKLSWEEYIEKLRAEKNPAAAPFGLARLVVKSDNIFEVETANNIEQKFIEAERNHLFSFLQQRLKNRLLQFQVVVVESLETDRPPIEAPLNSKQQFLKMVEQYPLVKELRDRLKLDLDF